MTRRNIARLIEAGDTGADAFLRAHPPLVENLATARIYEIGAETGARAHAVHVSTSRGFEICNMYKRPAGYKATAESCVQYFMLNAEEHGPRFGAKIKHYPPIRPKAESDLLWSHLAMRPLRLHLVGPCLLGAGEEGRPDDLQEHLGRAGHRDPAVGALDRLRGTACRRPSW